MFTGTTTLNAKGEEVKTSRFKRELSKMSEKQASQIQIAIWVIGGLCVLVMGITGASIGYVLNQQNKRQDESNKRLDALEEWRNVHTPEVNVEARLKSVETELGRHDNWMKEHGEFSRNEVIKINNNLSRIAAKLNVELRQ